MSPWSTHFPNLPLPIPPHWESNFNLSFDGAIFKPPWLLMSCTTRESLFQQLGETDIVILLVFWKTESGSESQGMKSTFPKYWAGFGKGLLPSLVECKWSFLQDNMPGLPLLPPHHSPGKEEPLLWLAGRNNLFLHPGLWDLLTCGVNVHYWTLGWRLHKEGRASWLKWLCKEKKKGQSIHSIPQANTLHFSNSEEKSPFSYMLKAI